MKKRSYHLKDNTLAQYQKKYFFCKAGYYNEGPHPKVDLALLGSYDEGKGFLETRVIALDQVHVKE